MSGAIRTKEGWAAWVNQQPPPPLEIVDHKTYQGLSQAAQEEADELRLQHNARPVIVRTSASAAIQEELSSTLRLNRDSPPGARGGAVIDGRPTVGKTTLLIGFGRRWERSLRRREPELFADQTVDHQPVVYLTLPAAASPKSLAASLCEYLNIPRRTRDTQADLTRRVLDAFDICGTQLVLVDDLHFLDLSQKDGRFTNDFLKELANSCMATFVYAGVELGDSTLFNEGAGKTRDTQTSGRFTVYNLRPFDIRSAPGKQEWIRTIKAMEDPLVLYRHEPESLARQHWRYLHQRTQGSISSLSQLIRRAADRAVTSGKEMIDQQLLATLTSDLTSQRAYRKTTRKSSASRRESA